MSAGDLVERRDERWLARLGGDRIAWFAASDAGRTSMQVERRLLELLQARCAFAVPRVLGASPGDVVQLRTMVPAPREAAWVYGHVCADRDAAVRLGTSLGAVLADLHAGVPAGEVAGWLPSRPPWPEPRGWILERLPHVVDDADLVARAGEVLARVEALPLDPADRVLLHGDFGFHNLGVDPDTFDVLGVFDWASACVAGRHVDFRYLLVAADDEPLFDAARRAYEPRTGRTIDLGQVLLHNAAAAVCWLASRVGVAPDVRWCGRTLDEDLRWSRHALRRALLAPAP